MCWTILGKRELWDWDDVHVFGFSLFGALAKPVGHLRQKAHPLPLAAAGEGELLEKDRVTWSHCSTRTKEDQRGTLNSSATGPDCCVDCNHPKLVDLCSFLQGPHRLHRPQRAAFLTRVRDRVGCGERVSRDAFSQPLERKVGVVIRTKS